MKKMVFSAAATAALLLCTAACSYRMRDAGRRAPASSTAESVPAATQTTENGRSAPATAETEREMPPVTTAGSSSAATTSPKTAPQATRPREETAAPPPVTAPPVTKPTENRQALYEQELRALTDDYTQAVLQAKRDKSEVEGILVRLSSQRFALNTRTQQEIAQLQRERDDKVGEAMAMTGGQKNSNAVTIENQYNARINALRQERARELEALDSQYREANMLAAAIDLFIEDISAQYEADKAQLREKYGIS